MHPHFLTCLQALRVKPEQTLFIDDRDANVKTAIALGGYAIKYESVRQLATNLKALHFPVLPLSLNAMRLQEWSR